MYHALARSAMLRGVEPVVAEELAGSLDCLDVDQGAVIFHEGDPGDSLFVVVAGKVKLDRRAGEHGRSLVGVVGPSDMFGALAMFDPGPRVATATAMVDSTVAAVTSATLRSWLSRQPQIYEQMLRALARRLRHTDEALADRIFTDVPGRVAKQLLRFADSFGSREGDLLRVTHGLTQKEFAQLIGAGRETVNRALADFAARGWLRLDGKGVVVTDVERLARRATA